MKHPYQNLPPSLTLRSIPAPLRSLVSAALLLLLLSGFSSSPEENTCALVVDAGSSGTRLQVFPLPWEHPIKPPKKKKVSSIQVGLSWPFEGTKGLSAAHATTVSKLVGCLATMGAPAKKNPKLKSNQSACVETARQLNLTFKTKKNRHFKRCQRVHLFIYGTGGMRLIERSNDYSAYWRTITDHFTGALAELGKEVIGGEAGTLSGYEEGLFEFLALEATRTPRPGETPRLHGYLGIGGASAQILWEASAPPPEVDFHTIEVDHAPIPRRTLAGYSFLGWGINQAFANLPLAERTPCTAGEGRGSFKNCKRILKSKLLNSPKLPGQRCPPGTLEDPLNYPLGVAPKKAQCVSLKAFAGIKRHLPHQYPLYATGGALKYMTWPHGSTPLEQCCTTTWKTPDLAPSPCSYRPRQSCFRGAWAEAIVEALELVEGWDNKGDARWQLGAVLCQLSNQGSGCIKTTPEAPLRCRWKPTWNCPKRLQLP